MQEPKSKEIFCFCLFMRNVQILVADKSAILLLGNPLHILSYVLVPIIYFIASSNLTERTRAFYRYNIYRHVTIYIIQPKASKTVYDSKLSIINRLEYHNFLCQLFSFKCILVCEVYLEKALSGEYLTLKNVFYVVRLYHILNINKVDKKINLELEI